MPSLFAVLFALLALVQFPGYNPASNDVQDDRADVRRRVESFEKLVKDPEKDAEAVAMLDGMITMFKESGERDRGRILKSMVGAVKVFDAPKDKSKGRNLPVAVAERLSQMGTEALKSVLALMSDTKVGKEMPRLVPLASGLVKLGIGTPEALDASLKMLEDPNPRLFVALSQAFGQMELETQAKRKRLVAAMLTAHETFQKRVDTDKSVVLEDKPKLADAGRAAAIATLNALAAQKQPDLAAFKTWFAANKDQPWPEK